MASSSSSKKWNIAVVGLGFGAEFIPIWQRHPQTNCYAICQRDQKKLDAIGDAFGIATRYTDFESVLKDPTVDAVHINSPIPDHGWMSIAALKAGKHVACTVPMATGVAECKQIVDLVKKTGLKYMMMETVVYAREYLYMRDCLTRGLLANFSLYRHPTNKTWMAGRITGLAYHQCGMLPTALDPSQASSERPQSTSVASALAQSEKNW